MPINIKNIPLNAGEYYTDKIKKDTIYLHHTAGGHRPDWTVAGWNADKTASGQQLKVATSYVMGGLSTSDNDASWDGVVVSCFPDDMWAHHLGLTTANNVVLNQKSIGIEICNYGPLTKLQDGRFLNYVNKPVPASQVVELEKPFQGYKYYHKYTDKQIEALKQLLQQIAQKHGIDLKAGLKSLLDAGKGVDAFLLNNDALAGKPGVWTHTNVRKDKFDCSPQANLMAMLKSL